MEMIGTNGVSCVMWSEAQRVSAGSVCAMKENDRRTTESCQGYDNGLVMPSDGRSEPSQAS